MNTHVNSLSDELGNEKPEGTIKIPTDYAVFDSITDSSYYNENILNHLDHIGFIWDFEPPQSYLFKYKPILVYFAR